MEYKGYTGIVEYDEDAQIFSGMVINTRDVITFQGESVGELKKAFEDVDITMSLGEDLAMNLSFLHYADRVVTLKGCWLYNYRVLDKSAAHGYSEALEKKLKIMDLYK